MTEANRESCKVEGEKDDLRIEDWLLFCVFDEAAGFALEEIFEVTPLVGLYLPISCEILSAAVNEFDLGWITQRSRPKGGAVASLYHSEHLQMGAETFFDISAEIWTNSKA